MSQDQWFKRKRKIATGTIVYILKITIDGDKRCGKNFSLSLEYKDKYMKRRELVKKELESRNFIEARFYAYAGGGYEGSAIYTVQINGEKLLVSSDEFVLEKPAVNK